MCFTELTPFHAYRCGRRARGSVLERPQARVAAALVRGDELVVAAVLDDAAAVENEHTVCERRDRERVRRDDHGAAAGDAGDRREPLTFRGGVEAGRRLV